MSATDIAKIADKIIETRTELGGDLLNQYEKRMAKIDARIVKYAEEKIFLHIKKEIVDAAHNGRKEVNVPFNKYETYEIFHVSKELTTHILNNELPERLKKEGYSVDVSKSKTGWYYSIIVKW